MFFTRKRLKLYLAGLVIVQLATCLGFRSSVQSGAIDLRVYYTAGYMLRTGQTALLYNLPAEKLLQNQLVAPMPAALAFFAPPFAALPFAPLSLVTYRQAFWFLLAINLALLLLAAHIMRPHLTALAERWPPLPYLLFITFIPAGLTLVMGQVSIFMLLFFCMSFASLHRSRPFLAGLVLSLALIKFQIALPVALLFLLWRQWRFIAGFLTGSSLLAALSVFLIGARESRLYLHTLLSGTGPLAAASTGTNNVSVHRMPNLYGLLATVTGHNHLSLVLTLAACLALLAWAAFQRPSLPLALLISVGTGLYLFPCDLALLLLPLSLLCNQLFAEDDALPATAPPPHLSWLQKHRRDILFCALGTFLIGPALIEIIVNNLIFLLALPILALALCPCD
ncbi:MAG TPA: glycosyltransferase family 87 protein [Acidobacteriaceae bacterium]|nr:glycosyltransferase family 87 protein [Acidobacteriaceae bacterium]